MSSVHSSRGGAAPPTVVFVGHDASRTGAPIVLLHLLRWLKAHTSLAFEIVLLEGGALAPEFAALAPTITLNEVSVGRSRWVRRIGRIPGFGPCLKGVWHHLITPRVVNQQKPRVVYANTVATASLLRQLVPSGVPLIVHVHELERAIQVAAGHDGMATIKALARRYVAASDPVRENLVARHDVDPSLIETIPEFITIDESVVDRAAAHRQTMRRTLSIPSDAPVVGGCGATGRRKGVDLFVEMARAVAARWKTSGDPVHFVWVGRVADDDFTRSVLARVQAWGLGQVCHFVEEHPRPVELFCGFDVFALPSREDPMPLVALEAAAVGRPILCFDGTGGMPAFVEDECGRVVFPVTGEALATAAIELLTSPELRTALGNCASAKVRSAHQVEQTAPRILKLIEETAGL